MGHIEIRDLTRVYGGGNTAQVVAIDHISFDISAGEFIVILGASGAGKSTLLNILGGMDMATSGTYVVDGKNIADLKDKELAKFRRNDIGFVFQFYNLMPNLTALENILLAASVVDNPFDAKQILKKVGLEGREGSFPAQLSGGEQQRVAIARAVVKNPKLLLCDEPTGALDSKTGSTILALLASIAKDYNKTVIIVTHNSKIAEIAERVIRIQDGKIIADVKNVNPLDVSKVKW
ncbi:MAG: ABC transporter ATP-binding protein [Bacilli bacterium]|jgi:putative ABC transport system ATP-binding protein